jgi:hypothetical protein
MGLLTAPTPVFASPSKTAVSWSSGSKTDVFSRRQRTPATSFDLSSHEMTDIEFEIGDRCITISHSGAVSRSSWVFEVLRSLASRWGATLGWDGYDALPTNPELVAELLNSLQVTMRDRDTPPVITPLGDGGIQAEWHRGESTLEIVVAADAAARFYFYDELTGDEESGLFAKSVSRISQLIKKF